MRESRDAKRMVGHRPLGIVGNHRRVNHLRNSLQSTHRYLHEDSPMKLLMAMSKDGYLAKGPEDDMKWTGSVDKRDVTWLSLTPQTIRWTWRWLGMKMPC